jgi:hypothetical protein
MGIKGELHASTMMNAESAAKMRKILPLSLVLPSVNMALSRHINLSKQHAIYH